MTDRTADVLGLEIDNVPAKFISAVRVGIGIVSAIALFIGVALLVWPGRTLVVAGALIGINLLVSGVVRLGVGVFGTAYSGGMRALSIILGLFVLLGGIIMLRNLESSTAILLLIMTIIVGISWIIEGIVALVDSDKAPSRGWAITLGILSIVAGVAVVAMPGWTAVVFVTFAAIMLIVLGLTGIIRAFRFGSGRVVEA